VEPLAASGDDLVVALWVTPGAQRSCVTGVRAGRVAVTVAAPAREGRANDELVAFLAKLLGVPRTAVDLVAGTRSRRKVARIRGIGIAEARARLRPPDHA
jgi:uncharacterized protein